MRKNDEFPFIVLRPRSPLHAASLRGLYEPFKTRLMCSIHAFLASILFSSHIRDQFIRFEGDTLQCIMRLWGFGGLPIEASVIARPANPENNEDQGVRV